MAITRGGLTAPKRSKQPECTVEVQYAGPTTRHRGLPCPPSAHYYCVRRPTRPCQPDQSLCPYSAGGGCGHGRARAGVGYTEWAESALPLRRVLRPPRRRVAL